MVAENIATGDELIFSDVGDNGIHKETIDDLFKIGPALVADAAVAQASDSIIFIDADDSNNAKKETVADFVDAINGTGIDAGSGHDYALKARDEELKLQQRMAVILSKLKI